MIESPIYAERHFGDVSALVTSRFGGVSRDQFSSFNLATHVNDDQECVSQNRTKLSTLLHADSLKILSATHGADVQVVAAHSQVNPGDGLVTRATNLGLVALAADCVTIALVDPETKVVAVGHCGWQGLVAGLPEVLAQTFIREGGIASHSHAVLGPAICGNCYEVDADRAAQVAKVCPSAVVAENHIAVSTGVIAQLSGFGFEIEQIPGCTFESEQLFSYRRDEITGRHALAVVIHQGENEL